MSYYYFINCLQERSQFVKKLRRGLLLAVALFLILSLLPGLPAKAAEEPVIRVKLKNYLGNQSQITVKPEVSYSTNLSSLKLEANQTYTLKVSSGNIVILKGSTEVGKAAQVEAKPVKGDGPLSLNGRKYLGSFTFTIENGKYIRPINSIGLEDYLKGVVPFEMPALWHLEALKAQTVAARTYAMGYISKTVDDTQSYQVYGGYAWHENSTKAVEATEGQVITYGGSPIGAGAVFSSSNGGKTESNTNAWGSQALPYLTIKDDPYDPKTVWSFSIKKKQIDTSKLDLAKADKWWATTKEAEQTMVLANMKAWLQVNGYPNKDIKITAVPAFSLHGKTSGGRVSKGSITIEFLIKEKEKALVQRLELKDVSASKIRAIVGYNLMKSFLVDNVDTATDTIKVSGKGYGHGVGLSQYGAKKAAEVGKNYKEILTFYYENTILATLYKSAPEQPEPVDPAPAPVKPAPTPTPENPIPPPVKDEKAPVIKDVKLSYDSKTNQVKLGFAINENAKVTVYVKDQNGEILTYLINGSEKKAGSHSAVWNVSKVNNGKYTFGIIAVDGSNNRSSVTVPFTLTKHAPKDTTAPVIKNMKTSFDSKTNKVFLRYEINESAKVTVYVKDSKGKILEYLVKNTQKQKGTQWASWNVAKVNNGTYKFVITATDSSNNKRSAETAYTLTKPAKKVTGKVNATKLNVRSKPSTSAKILGYLKKNQTVTVLRKTGSWYEIEYGKGKGYVYSKYVTIVR
jgi:stage II sporulation protein D